MEEIAVSMCIDYLISGGYKKEEIKQIKDIATKTIQEGGFTSDKRHTNCNMESHESYYEKTGHQFTNQITTNLQKSEAQNLVTC